MSSSSGPTLLRVTVEGGEGLTVDIDPSALPDAAGHGPQAVALPATRRDRDMGRTPYEVTVDGWVLRVSVEPADLAELRERAGRTVVHAGHGGAHVMRAQIPGRLVRLWVAEGDTVEVGQRLLAIEAMKMENEVRASRAGQVTSIAAAIGANVELGDELLVIR